MILTTSSLGALRSLRDRSIPEQAHAAMDPTTSPATRRTYRRRSGRIGVVARIGAVVLAAFVAACGSEDDPVVVAGALSFSSEEVLGLTPDRQRLLGELAVFATAVADSSLATVGRPWVEARVAEVLWDRLRAQAALDSAGVGDDVLRARYRLEPELELTVRHLLVFSARYESDATRAEARAKASAALDRIRSGEDFGVVAADVSEEPGAESREGLLTPGRVGSWVPEFWAAAAVLAPGDISPVVETQYGFHVLRLEARDTVAFDEARSRVASEVAGLMGLRPDGMDGVPLPPDLPGPPPTDVGEEATPIAEGLSDGAPWSVTLGDLRDAEALLPYSSWRRRETDPEVRMLALEGAVRRAVVSARARAAGIELSDAERAAIEREWTSRGETWAEQLGLTAGLSAERLHRAALDALANSGQNASIARDGLRDEWGGSLHRWSPIVVEETPPGSGP